MKAVALRDAVESLGWPGVAGVALLTFALGLLLSSLRPALEEREVLRDQAQRLEQRHKASGAQERRATTVPEQLGNFYAFFPASGSTPEWLKKIDAAAASKGLQLASGEYKVVRSSAHKLSRYEITLPVQGSYPQIRAFIGQVLVDVPAAAVEEVTLKRDTIENARLEARIRLTLYLAA